ncbi:MAG: rhomboid family intramembrane serine protease [Xenococcus sp. MO_188.B8]|nr:rhomboid family intramembrane serine protease [Xenococcus sp. MO_188.B8]
MIKINGKRAYITYTLIFINLMVFLLEMRSGGSTNLQTLYTLGALVAENVKQGEWWRLLSANFLHFGWLHLISNMLALLFIGSIVELSIGVERYLIIYFLSGAGSMLAFALLADYIGQVQVVLMGASAAIMGTIGTMLVTSWQAWLRHKTYLNAKRLRTVIFVIVLQFILDNIIPSVSFYSHLFGFTIGFMISLILLRWNFSFK